MTSFLLLLSFLIHLILFITIYHIYERTKRDKDEQAKQLERMLANFMNDIRLENNKLEQKIHENDLRHNINYEYTPIVRKQPVHMRNDLKKEEQTRTTTESYVPNRQQPSSNEIPERMEQHKEDVIETSIEGQVMHLFESGKTVDEIAKQLHRGKTEVELLIKLNRTANN